MSLQNKTSQFPITNFIALIKVLPKNGCYGRAMIPCQVYLTIRTNFMTAYNSKFKF